tara:strand:+ start:549 stop:815 length:267 start_codon:yes stop_codon:yes gene_type:complete
MSIEERLEQLWNAQWIMRVKLEAMKRRYAEMDTHKKKALIAFGLELNEIHREMMSDECFFDVQEETVQKVKERIEASQARLAALEREK